jgi:hypothetical protein
MAQAQLSFGSCSAQVCSPIPSPWTSSVDFDPYLADSVEIVAVSSGFSSITAPQLAASRTIAITVTLQILRFHSCHRNFSTQCLRLERIASLSVQLYWKLPPLTSLMIPSLGNLRRSQTPSPLLLLSFGRTGFCQTPTLLHICPVFRGVSKSRASRCSSFIYIKSTSNHRLSQEYSRKHTDNHNRAHRKLDDTVALQQPASCH